VPQEIRKIAPEPAAGVEHPPAAIESAAQELIEQIDVDLAELLAQFDGRDGDVGGHPRMILRGGCRSVTADTA
jgi:hypothetical protein